MSIFRVWQLAQFELTRLFATKRGLLALGAFAMVWFMIQNYLIAQAVPFLSSPEFADLLNRARQPFNVNGLAMAAGLAAIADDDYVQRSRALNKDGMAQITQGLEAQGYPFIPSVGNFVAFDSGRAGADVFDDLLRQGVIVRPIAEYGLPNHVRVSIGLPIENERFLSALAALGPG